MRRFFITLIVLALMWCGWWLLGAYAMERGMTAWLEARRAEGWQAEVTERSVSGFPLSFTSQVEGIVLAPPSNAARLEIGSLKGRIPSYWPLSLQLALPETPISLETPIERYFLKTTNGRVNGAANLAARLKSADIQSDDWQLNATGGNILSGEDLLATVTQGADSDDTYHLAADATALTPGDVLRQTIGLPPEWPRPLSLFSVALSVTIAPGQRDQDEARLRALELTKVDVVWGSLGLSAAGQITVDAGGIPDGDLNLTVRNWREAYEIAKQNGLAQPEFHLRYDLLLNGLSNIGGDPSTLDLTLSFQGGQMYLGRIPLGPAPKIVL